MKIENKNWNDIVQALQNHPSEIDLDRQWAGLERRLYQKKKRRFLLFWLIGLGIFSAALLTCIYPSFTKWCAQHEMHNNTFAHNTTNFSENRNYLDNDKLTGILSNDNISENKASSAKKSVDISEDELRQNHQNFSETTFEFKSDEEKNHMENNDILVKEVMSNTSAIREEIMPVKALPVLHTSIEGNLSELATIHLPIKVHKKRNNMWLDLTASVGFHTNTFKALNHQSESIIKSNLKPLENFSLKWSLGKVLYKKIYVTSGLQYQRYNDVLSRAIVRNETSTLDDQLVETYTNSQGEVSNRYADITVVTTSTVKEKRFNQHHFLNLDLGLGYNINIAGKERLQIEVGAGKCLWLKEKGYIENNKGHLMQLNDVTSDFATFNFYSSIYYNWSIGKEYKLLLGYAFNSFNYRYEDLYTKEVKNNSIGLTLRKLLN